LPVNQRFFQMTGYRFILVGLFNIRKRTYANALSTGVCIYKVCFGPKLFLIFIQLVLTSKFVHSVRTERAHRASPEAKAAAPILQIEAPLGRRNGVGFQWRRSNDCAEPAAASLCSDGETICTQGCKSGNDRSTAVRPAGFHICWVIGMGCTDGFGLISLII